VLIGEGDEDLEKEYTRRRGWHLLKIESPARKTPNYLERAHALIGETVDRRHVERIVEAARRCRGKCAVIGRGRLGVLAAYAALMEPDISLVSAIDPPASHRDGPHFLGVMRILDVPTAFGLLAPRSLILKGAKDKAFDHTEALYKAAGAADKLTRTK
jgi:hypothetical protein